MRITAARATASRTAWVPSPTPGLPWSRRTFATPRRTRWVFTGFSWPSVVTLGPSSGSVQRESLHVGDALPAQTWWDRRGWRSPHHHRLRWSEREVLPPLYRRHNIHSYQQGMKTLLYPSMTMTTTTTNISRRISLTTFLGLHTECFSLRRCSVDQLLLRNRPVQAEKSYRPSRHVRLINSCLS